MSRLILASAALLALAACDRSDPPVNQIGIDMNAISPAPAPPAETAEPLAPGNTTAPVAATMLPAAYHGVFDQTAAACAAASSIYRLTVSAGELRFHESLAAVKSVTADGPGALRVAADYSGEGMEWSNIQRVALSDGGTVLTITGEGEPTIRRRCA